MSLHLMPGRRSSSSRALLESWSAQRSVFWHPGPPGSDTGEIPRTGHRRLTRDPPAADRYPRYLPGVLAAMSGYRCLECPFVTDTKNNIWQHLKQKHGTGRSKEKEWFSPCLNLQAFTLQFGSPRWYLCEEPVTCTLPQDSSEWRRQKGRPGSERNAPKTAAALSQSPPAAPPPPPTHPPYPKRRRIDKRTDTTPLSRALEVLSAGPPSQMPITAEQHAVRPTHGHALRPHPVPVYPHYAGGRSHPTGGAGSPFQVSRLSTDDD